MADEFLRLENLVKAFGANTVVEGANLAFTKGEFVTLLGSSSCGKTTIQKMIASIERPTYVQILVESNDISPLPPNQRKIGMVFQAYALFPNMNVKDKIVFWLKNAGVGTEE